VGREDRAVVMGGSSCGKSGGSFCSQLKGRGQEEAWESPHQLPKYPELTHSQMKVPCGMVCRARTPQPILAVR
jgi:hypothetical protein